MLRGSGATAIALPSPGGAADPHCLRELKVDRALRRSMLKLRGAAAIVLHRPAERPIHHG
ncbi:MAG: hypothetical protein DMF19_06230 [Verrucomicrobia bacterium]|nr:MAG: hypothetical protein DMF19_06230 [Verrucomicrobiota bacterium]